MPDTTFIAPIIRTPLGQRNLPIRFGLPEDAELLSLWQVGEGHSSPLAAKDAMEYAMLASKRWRYYVGREEGANSLDELMIKVGGDSLDETGFLLVACADWDATPEILAIAWCRRSWCHHLILDFLACHPIALDSRSGYAGVGSAMLLAIGLITARAEISLIWGEATALSAGFYSKRILAGKPVKDHFFIRDGDLAMLQKESKRFRVLHDL